jgi:ribokinase
MVFDIITIGDTTTDIFLEIDENSPLCKVDKKKLELKLKYKSKIPVKSMHRVIGGGNASNHAVGASRLGLRTAIYTMLGDDDAGDAVCHKYRREKISNKYLKIDSKHGTNLATVIDYAGDRTILSYHAKRKYKLPKFEKTKWIYFSSISGNHKEFNDELISYVKRNKIKLGFNPGSKQMALGVAKLKPIFAVCEVVFVNLQEAQRLTKKTKNVKLLLKEMKKYGSKLVVITDGENGSYSYDGDVVYKIGKAKFNFVESTGSGDAYASGFVSALINKKKVPEAMKWGAINAGSVLSEIGSQKGLLTKNKLKGLLKEQKTLEAKSI